jgi:protein-L-isoaspartate(D-aspartate) O-methyltransferase
MIETLRRYGIRDERVLAAMATVRRHVYIPEPHRDMRTAYGDFPLPIGAGQTISQPYIVAYMTELLAVQPGDRVLEIGTGSGYQSAVLAQLGARVFTVERVPALADHARDALAAEGYADAVEVRTGDGYEGWSEHAPYDAVVLTAAPPRIPDVVAEQLREGGRCVLPVGGEQQKLIVGRKRDGRLVTESTLDVRFVPMVHGAGPSGGPGP